MIRDKIYIIIAGISLIVGLALCQVVRAQPVEPVSRSSLAQDMNLRFEHLTVEQGLSTPSITGIMQDSIGFMWFGTYDGLNRYDGYRVTVFMPDASNSTSINHNVIQSLYVDHDGVLWVGTGGGGLNRFDQTTEQFTHYQHRPEDPASLSHNFVTAIHEDQDGTLWIGSGGGGLNRFDQTTEQFTHYQHRPEDPASLSHNFVTAIHEDQDGTLWIGTEGGGLNKLDRATGRFTHYMHEPGNTHSLSDDVVRSIYEDRTGVLWIGTEGGGLNKLDRATGRFTHYMHEPENALSLSDDHVRSICEDQSGVLWVGTYGGGLDKLDKTTGRFVHYTHKPDNPLSISNNNVTSIYEDKGGVLWIGTEGGGLERLDRASQRITLYRHQSGNPQSLSDNGIRSIYEDQAGMLWIGTMGGGLNKLDRTTGRFTHYMHEPGNSASLSDNDVRSIYEDKSGVVWIGTYGGGLNKLDRTTGRFTHYVHEPGNAFSLSHNRVVKIYEDRDGVLWIGTWGGLNKLDRTTGRFTRYLQDPDDPYSVSNNGILSFCEDQSGAFWIGTMDGLNRLDRATGRFSRWGYEPENPFSLSHNTIPSIYEDRSGVVWIGTYGGGLNRFDRATGKFSHISDKDGLPNNVIYGILEEKDGSLWMSTNRGITRFQPNAAPDAAIRNFDVRDGLQGNEFNRGAYLKSRNGEMFFGGMGGLNAFHPELVTANPYIPPVVITNLRLFNSPAPIDPNGFSILRKSIVETDSLVLSYDQSVISFDFAAMHFAHPERNQYTYMMEGFDKDWVYAANKRDVTYTNLDPGTYSFRVKGSNSDGVWNENGVAIHIFITPPWWQTWWFRLVVGGMLVALVGGGYRARIGQMDVHRQELEQQVAEQTRALVQARDAAETANRTKSEFLANMSHEIRTPMNAILGFTEILNSLISDRRQRDYLASVRTSSKTLLTLINDILDLSKVEAGKIELEYVTVDPYRCCKEIQNMFSRAIEEKGLEFIVEIAPDLPAGLILDEVRVRQVLVNLIGNAVKFTRTGYIKLSVRKQAHEQNSDTLDLIFEVSDTGIGISERDQPSIFEAFEQRRGQSVPRYGGTGLGLAITKRLVEMMAGKIAVQSWEGVGSTFTVTLKEVATASVVHGEMWAAPSIDVNAVRFSSATILIVDDLEVNRNLVRAYLAMFPFAVLEASNGEEALEVIEQHRPDLVLMDMKMPVMDGYEAIRILKERDDLRDIPVVALTASAMKQSEEVIRRVSDGFLPKPVSRLELVMEISQFLAHTFEEAACETIEPPLTDAVPVSVSEPLDGETLLKLPELIRRLEAELPAWEALCRTLTINDIEAFADQMRALGEENNYGPLSAWGEQLGLQAGLFDLAAISAKLEGYPELIGQMQALLNNER